MYIAVTGMHMQGNEYAAVQNFLVDGVEFFLHLYEHATGEHFIQGQAYLALPGGANLMGLQ